MRKPTYRWSLDKKSFCIGFAGALAIFLLFATLAVSMFAKQGVTVQLDSEEMARTIQTHVVAQAKLELPEMIEGVKAEIPRIVEEEMQEKLSDRMEIAGFVFTMPEELMEQLSIKMRTNVENATAEILDGINTQVLAEQFGDNVYTMVKQTMAGELNEQSFRVFLFERIPVLIRVQVTEGK